ncbi:MAG: FecR domain-containing protein [Kiritimatiellae bacterium]|nr:FecR domain-containing protein [Kiritimatiellia bacterium]
MNPAEFERLAWQYLDGTLDAAGAETVKERLRADPEAARRFAELSVLHVGIHKCLVTDQHARVAQSEDGMGRVLPGEDGEEQEWRAEMHPRPRRRGMAGERPGWSPPARRRSWWRTALAASVLVAVGLFIGMRIGQLKIGETPPAGGAMPILAQVRGSVAVGRAGERRAAVAGAALRAGETVATGGNGSEAVLRYPEAGTIEMGADTELQLGVTSPAVTPAGKPSVFHGFVVTGSITADLAGAPAQALLFGTPHAEIRVVGTRFSVVMHGTQTVVEVMRGELHVRNVRSGRAAPLREGYRAVAGADGRLDVAKTGQAPGGGPAAPPTGLLARYTFDERAGAVVRDVSNTGRALDLRIRDPKTVEWLTDGGLALRRPTVIASEQPARKIVEACRASNELSVEVWVRTVGRQPSAARAGKEFRRIVSLSSDPYNRNFSLGEAVTGYAARLRTTATNENGVPELLCRPWNIVPGLYHLVLTRDRNGVARLFVNGLDRLAGTLDYDAGRTVSWKTPVLVPGDFSNWNPAFPLVLGDEPEGTEPGVRSWLGVLRYVAIFSRALPPDEVARNYQDGQARYAGMVRR